ncbi:MAG: hypothetical protein AAB373_02640, partial [Patescibacteria group bacterium]
MKIVSQIMMFLGLLILTACNQTADDKELVYNDETDQKLEVLRDKVKDLENEMNKNPVIEEEKPKEEVVAKEEVKTEEKAEVTDKKELEKKVVEPKNFIKLDSSISNGSTFTAEPVLLKGTVSPTVTKIVVTGTQKDKYTDVYQLAEFKTGDMSFEYRSKVEWGNLALGKNNYELKAYY